MNKSILTQKPHQIKGPPATIGQPAQESIDGADATRSPCVSDKRADVENRLAVALDIAQRSSGQNTDTSVSFEKMKSILELVGYTHVPLVLSNLLETIPEKKKLVSSLFTFFDNCESRLEESGLPNCKSIEGFKMQHIADDDDETYAQFKQGGFLKNKKSILFTGPRSIGKTHHAVALGVQAVACGKSVAFVNYMNLANSLVAGAQNLNNSPAHKDYQKVELLIVDDVRAAPVGKLGCKLAFELIAGRMEKASTIMTSRICISKWVKVFAAAGDNCGKTVDWMLMKGEYFDLGPRG